MPPETTNDDLTVSVIVPTFNRCDRLERLFDRLEACRAAHPAINFTVELAVDGSTDGTRDMLVRRRTSFPLRVHWSENQGPAAARNRAMRAAAGDVLVFLDDDVMPVPDLVARHLDIHRRDPMAVVTGPMLEPPDLRLAPWLEWEAMMLRKQYRAMTAGEYAPTPRQFYTANASVRREQAMAVGGFDERFTRAEDVELAFRLARRGVRFYFAAEAVVWHEPDRSFASWLRVPYEYGRHDIRIERKRIVPTVRWALREQRQRNLICRTVSRVCAGHPRRADLVTRALAGVIQDRRALAPRRVQLALCSILFNLQYWQGVANESGLKATIWRRLEAQALA